MKNRTVTKARGIESALGSETVEMELDLTVRVKAVRHPHPAGADNPTCGDFATLVEMADEWDFGIPRPGQHCWDSEMHYSVDEVGRFHLWYGKER